MSAPLPPFEGPLDLNSIESAFHPQAGLFALDTPARSATDSLLEEAQGQAIPGEVTDISAAESSSDLESSPRGLTIDEPSGLTSSIRSPHGLDREFNAQQVKLFISYSHRDERYFNQLIIRLVVLYREGVIAQWHDRMIRPGADWRKAIDYNLDSADCVLLLVSPDFIASDYCYGIEMKKALRRHLEEGVPVIPVIVRPAEWRRTPLGDLKAIPKDGRAITEWSNRDRAWLEVAKALRLALDRQ